jgi:hypothetical protein
MHSYEKDFIKAELLDRSHLYAEKVAHFLVVTVAELR